MIDFRADLHCHSTFSDGSLTPQQLVALAKEKGLSGLSITDHDTVGAYAEAVPLFEAARLSFLTGVEFSTALSGHSVHILGYGFSPTAGAILDLCSKHTRRRESRNDKMLELLAGHSIDISKDDLAKALPNDSPHAARTIGRPHIALAMVKKGYVETPQEAFSKYLGEGRPCYVQGTTFTVDETIEAIHSGGGAAVIAHPHLIKNSGIVGELLKKPFDGIECYYGKFLNDEHKRWLKVARKKEWLITGGSDFHGAAKPSIELGCSWVGKEDFQAILDFLSPRS